MHAFILPHKQTLDNIVQNFKNELKTIRTGRVNPSMIEYIPVSVYDTSMKLIELASISTADQRTLVVEPWDKNILAHIEKVLLGSNLGFSVVSDGNLVRASMPFLTTESRKDIVKILYKKTEEAKISMRQIRDKIRTLAAHAESNKEITEDIKYNIYKQLDEEMSKYNDIIKLLSDEKEKEIMTI